MDLSQTPPPPFLPLFQNSRSATDLIMARAVKNVSLSEENL